MLLSTWLYTALPCALRRMTRIIDVY
uniref:Predicted protein n=1 Tax=Hordeum vulgare subsp. vulgare TaxID=112509 RepID=F2DAV8_HORVV|nr:predicted protein [Hordeum vulgare subsp. vulgare]